MGLLEEWRKIAYNEEMTQQQDKQLWGQYYKAEKGIYEQLLSDPETVVKGTVSELANKYETDIITMTGFLDGINESLKTANALEESLTEDTQVSLDLDLEKLYYNMIGAKADWLYTLPQWNQLLTEERRKELYKEMKLAGTVVKGAKIGRNDLCPCGSGKKYKKCCGI